MGLIKDSDLNKQLIFISDPGLNTQLAGPWVVNILVDGSSEHVSQV